MIQDAANGGKRVGMFTAINDIVRSEGVFALWKGLGPVLCKQGTNSAVRFACFASLKEEVKKRWPGKEKMVAVTLGIGGVSGIATVYVGLSFLSSFADCSSALAPGIGAVISSNFWHLIRRDVQKVSEVYLRVKKTPCNVGFLLKRPQVNGLMRGSGRR